ncbi:MAG: acyltransferase family protein [Coriobacteriia bacterium]|nr:acyltransferase family protein [Coriobacteriia bacterium]
MGQTKKHISSQFIGSQCKAIVKPGDKVNNGTVIAFNDADDSKIYSTGTGIVKKVTSVAVIIETEIEIKPETKPVEPAPKKKIINIDALDGLRTLAIVSVMIYHLNFGWFKGGLIGVTMFFVLSGYLITGLIKEEIETTGKLSLKNFWIHRVRRLFPAIAIVVIVVAILCVIFNHLLLTKMKPDIIPSLVWLQNWWYIIRDLSYFDAIGDPSPLVHFWSLAIEEQFYLIWPLILIGTYKIGAKHKIIRRACLVLAILSALKMAFIYNPDSDPTRAYYGTDTRAFSLLLGAWLAYVWPWKRMNSENRNYSSDDLFKTDFVGAICLIGLIAIMVLVDGLSPLMYYGIIFLASVLTMFLIGVLVVPGSKIAAFFALKPIAWIGKRSYGMYLWHFPLILLLKPICDGLTNTWWFAILILALTIGIAAVQYKFIENPIRRGLIGRWYSDFKARKHKPKVKEIVIAVVCAVVILGTTIAVVATPDETYIPEGALDETGDSEDQSKVMEGHYYPLLISDSIAGEIQLNKCFPYGMNDSVVGRTLSQAVDVIKDYTQKNKLGNVVVVDCFSNHLIEKGELDKILTSVGPDRQLFLVNSYLQHPTCFANNETIQKFQSEHTNQVHIIDWYKAVSMNPDAYLYKDNIHPNATGQVLFVQLLANAINDFLPDNAKCNTATIEKNLAK